MRIFGHWGEFDAPYVVAILVCEKLNLRKLVDFLIDTGASRTTILDSDAIQLGIDYSKLERLKEGTTGIGGVVDTFILPQVKLLFRTEDGSIHEEQLGEVFVLRHEAKDKQIEERVKRIPSLLGRDVLNKYALLLERVAEVVIIADEAVK